MEPEKKPEPDPAAGEPQAPAVTPDAGIAPPAVAESATPAVPEPTSDPAAAPAPDGETTPAAVAEADAPSTGVGVAAPGEAPEAPETPEAPEAPAEFAASESPQEQQEGPEEEAPRVEPVPAGAAAAAVGAVDTAGAAGMQEAGAPPADSTPAAPSGPNWMLAFVCAWAGATALNEAWAVGAPQGWKLEALRSYGFLGYVLVGVGLLDFALEALRWGRRRNLVGLVLPALVTLGGVVALIMSQDPGRRI